MSKSAKSPQIASLTSAPAQASTSNPTAASEGQSSSSVPRTPTKRAAPGHQTLSSPNTTMASAPASASATAEQDTGAMQPPAKKSRTNTPWTAAEEQRLKTMREAGNSWADIAKTFPSRTEGSVKKHWYKDMHYAEFAEDESQALMNAIKEYETNKWKEIGKKVGKPAKACEQYAKEHFGSTKT